MKIAARQFTIYTYWIKPDWSRHCWIVVTCVVGANSLGVLKLSRSPSVWMMVQLKTCNESGRIPHTCLVLSGTYVRCFSNGKDGRRCGFVLGCGEALIPSVNVALNYAFRPTLSRRRQYESIILRFGFCWPLRALINYILYLLTDDRYSNGPQ